MRLPNSASLSNRQSRPNFGRQPLQREPLQRMKSAGQRLPNNVAHMHHPNVIDRTQAWGTTIHTKPWAHVCQGSSPLRDKPRNLHLVGMRDPIFPSLAPKKFFFKHSIVRGMPACRQLSKHGRVGNSGGGNGIRKPRSKLTPTIYRRCLCCGSPNLLLSRCQTAMLQRGSLLLSLRSTDLKQLVTPPLSMPVTFSNTKNKAPHWA